MIKKSIKSGRENSRKTIVVFHFLRDLSSVRADVTKSVRVVQGACMDLDKNLRGMDANTQSALEEERARRQKVIKSVHKEAIFRFHWPSNSQENQSTNLKKIDENLTMKNNKLLQL